MLENYDGFRMLYAKLTLTVSGITLEVRATGCGSGVGVYACQDIPEDTFIMTFAGSGPVVPNTCGYENQNQFQISETHSIVVANLAARFINHSCNPNCGHFQGTELYAIAHIAKGQELAYDYSCSMAADSETFDCHCGDRWCRGRIGNFADITDAWRKRYYTALGIVSPHCLSEPFEIGPTVADARRGDCLRVAGAGLNDQDLEFEVEDILRYRRGGDGWTEFGGRSERGWAYLEWQEDSPVFSLSVDDEKRGLSEIGLAQTDLARLAAAAPSAGAIEVDGRTFRYEGGGKIRRFTKKRHAPLALLHTWEFVSDDGKGSLSIEQEGNDPPEVSLGTWVHPSDVTVQLRRKQKKRKRKRR